MLWLQGWDRAPEIVKACLQTWQKHNSGWDIRALSLPDIARVLENDGLVSLVTSKNLPWETIGDAVRVALLRKYGGVWADGTCYCLKPLDEWLLDRLDSGFFAFANPGPDRMLSNWFLAAAPNNYIVERMYDLIEEYWSTRSICDHYYWFHYQFADAYRANPQFRVIWDNTRKLPAAGPCYYVPYDKTLNRPASFDDRKLLDKSPTPVLKLTHKLGATIYPDNSVLNYLVARANTNSISSLNFPLSKTELLLRRLQLLIKPRLGLRAKYHRTQNQIHSIVSNSVEQWRRR